MNGSSRLPLCERALHSWAAWVLGFVQELFAPTTDGDADQSEEELVAMPEVLPHITVMVASKLHAADQDVLGWCDSRTEFTFTLDLVLDGLEAQRVSARNAS